MSAGSSFHGETAARNYPVWVEASWRCHDGPGQHWDGRLLEWTLMRFLGCEVQRTRFWWAWVTMFRLQCSHDTTGHEFPTGAWGHLSRTEAYEHAHFVVCQLARVSKVFWTWLGRIQCCSCGSAKALRHFHWRWTDQCNPTLAAESTGFQYLCYPCRDTHLGLQNYSMNHHPVCRRCWLTPASPDSDE